MGELLCKVVKGHPELTLVPHPGKKDIIPCKFYHRQHHCQDAHLTLSSSLSLSLRLSHSHDLSDQGPFHSPLMSDDDDDEVVADDGDGGDGDGDDGDDVYAAAADDEVDVDVDQFLLPSPGISQAD